jgi:hypothetical protein
MPRQWDIVEVPGDVWPGEGGPEKFLAVVISSQFASEKANVFWVCPIGSSDGKRMEVGYVRIAQYKPKTMLGWWDRMTKKKLSPQPRGLDEDYAGCDMVRADLVFTVTRHEMRPTNYGAVDLKTRKQLAGTLRRFSAFAAPPR